MYSVYCPCFDAIDSCVTGALIFIITLLLLYTVFIDLLFDPWNRNKHDSDSSDFAETSKVTVGCL